MQELDLLAIADGLAHMFFDDFLIERCEFYFSFFVFLFLDINFILDVLGDLALLFVERVEDFELLLDVVDLCTLFVVEIG